MFHSNSKQQNTTEEDSAKLESNIFDSLGISYEHAYGHLPEQLAALEWLTARLPEGARVLDIGSGTGKPAAAHLVKAGCTVTGIDTSATMIELSHAK
ncbi:methyltransferase domain-containing protein, partial [Pseudonocardia sp. ICBG1122]|nr:methyltransferase domain-containing protein [Pseudonocardia pini]